MNSFDKWAVSQDYTFDGSPKYKDVLERQSMASKGADFSKDTLAEQMPTPDTDAAALGVGGAEAAGAATNYMPYIAGAKLGMDVLDKAYAQKNANANMQYQAKLNDFANRQKVLERLSKPMKV